jgi:RND family efflux transporter MFP subunit
MSSPRLLAVAVALVGVPLLGCGSGQAAHPATAAVVPEVHTALVETSGWERSVTAVGELAPFERTILATKVPGRLAKIAVDRGDLVKSGQLVAQLEAREYEMRVRAAEAAVGAARAVLGLPPADGEATEDSVDPETTSAVRLAQALLERTRLDCERARKLAQSGVDSQSVLDAAQAEQRAAESRLQEAYELVSARRATLAQRKAELEIARAQLEETSIEAPYDGRVERRLVSTGAYLATGDSLCELVRVEPLRVVLEIGERDAAEVRLGQTARVQVASGAAELSGPIVRLAPALSRDGRTLTAELELPNPGGAVRAGGFVEARVVTATDQAAPSVPLEAIATFAGLDKAFVVKDGVCAERRLRLGRRTAGRVEVLDGLTPGERVVLAPKDLGPGSAVRVVD